MTSTQEAIQEIKQNITPAQAIEFYTGQRMQRGKLLCPFHADRHPSLSVKGEKWCCWACGEKGDVIDFVQKYHGIGFRDAVARLASDFGIRVDIRPTQNEADQYQALWEQIARESDRENRRQVREYIDTEIDKLNACYRAALKAGAPDFMMGWLGEILDDLIMERM